ncbi:MAG: hypothetical protein K2X66_01110 [Cyanobacteria bacterium]|nr:hypothetical protein [Cyanobacteriota bacterium]
MSSTPHTLFNQKTSQLYLPPSGQTRVGYQHNPQGRSSSVSALPLKSLQFQGGIFSFYRALFAKFSRMFLPSEESYFESKLSAEKNLAKISSYKTTLKELTLKWNDLKKARESLKEMISKTMGEDALETKSDAMLKAVKMTVEGTTSHKMTFAYHEKMELLEKEKHLDHKINLLEGEMYYLKQRLDELEGLGDSTEYLSTYSFSKYSDDILESTNNRNPYSGDLGIIWEDFKNGTKNTDVLLKALPNLLLNQPLKTINELSGKFESHMDANSSKWGHDSDEAELLLLLNHPDLWDRDPYKIGSLTKAITSITRFINSPAVQLQDRTVKAWASIGFLTHSFRFWKWDAMGGEKSLLSQFGFKALPNGRPGDDFGKGFLYKDEASGVTVEFRRGYLLATHPDHGTLVIRNSSPAFGRDLMKHPAYLLPEALNEVGILGFNPTNLPQEKSVIHRNLFMGPDGKQNNADEHLLFLTEAIERVKEDYRRFKLDTSSFDGYGDSKYFTGHLSEGLPKIVSFFNQIQLEYPGKPLPNLAFVHPKYPIYQPNGVYEMTPAHLKELNQFIKGDLTGEALAQSDWLKFMTQHGVEQRGELVILDPDITP